MTSCVELKLYHYISLTFQFPLMPTTTMKVTDDTVTISGLDSAARDTTVQLQNAADRSKLQLFIEEMATSIKTGESVKYNFSKLCLVLVLE